MNVSGLLDLFDQIPAFGQLMAALGNDFPRLRLGIGRPPGRMDAAAYVLQDFGRDELPVVSEMLTTAAEAIESFVRHGINLTMTRYNGPVEGATQL